MPLLAPGSQIGILGGGQLGRMFCCAARRLGYAVHVYTPEANSPAGQVTNQVTIASYEDEDALAKFARAVDVITLEFENIPLKSLSFLAELTTVYPKPEHLDCTQDRVHEKRMLKGKGIPVTPFREIDSLADLQAARNELGSDLILKTRRFGYDGKGQRCITTDAEAEQAFKDLGGKALIAEKKVALALELSILVTRNLNGEIAVQGPFENQHENGILAISVYPARTEPALAIQAKELGILIVQKLEYHGILCVELFVTESGELLVNELAPRPHNSGHLTIEAFHTSQFEMHVRSICNLPPGSPTAKCSAAMVNLLGDLWLAQPPNWPALSQHDRAALHLYGKDTPHPGRKMGHITVCDTNIDQAIDTALSAKRCLFNL